MTTLLVTGATGYVGRHFVERARDCGYDVGVTSGDLCDPAVAHGAVTRSAPDAVVHLAFASTAETGGPWRGLIENMRLTSNLFESLADVVPGIPVLVPGSAAQYGMGAPKPITEDTPTEGISTYGAIKCALESCCLSPVFAGGLRVIWTRSFNHLGPGQPVTAPIAEWAACVAQIESGRADKLRTGRLDRVRDFLDVRDVCDAYLALVESDAEGVVNVCSGAAISLEAVVRQLIDLASSGVDIEHDSARDRAVDPPCVVGDVTRLRSTIAWEPRYELAASLADVLADARMRAATDATPTLGSGSRIERSVQS